MKSGPAQAVILGLCLVLAGCGGVPPSNGAVAPASPDATPRGADTLDGTTWALGSIADQPVPASTGATLAFASGTASGTSGCNTFSGPYAVDGQSLDIGPLTSTRKACPGPVMATEQAYFAALEAVTTWAVPQDAPMGTQLTLTGTAPKLVFGRPAGG